MILMKKQQRHQFTLAALAIGGVLWGSVPSSPAQLAPCPPPNSGEYLLLILSPTSESQAQARQALPSVVSISVCNYLNDTVTRAGGFTDLEVANAWATYMTETVGLLTYVARPATTTAVVPTPQPSPIATPTPRPSPSPVAAPSPLPYNPQPLGSGYAVLVDYGRQPEVAARLRQILGRDVGLVSYNQRPYLLANHTPAQGTANATLTILRDRGFQTMMVDGQQVVVMSRTVRY